MIFLTLNFKIKIVGLNLGLLHFKEFNLMNARKILIKFNLPRKKIIIVY